MARFFIHIQNDAGSQRDETGSEFADCALAVGEAASMAGEIVRSDAREAWHDRNLRLVIEAADHRPVATIEMTLSVNDANLR